MTMRDDLIKDMLPRHGEGLDPREMARRDLNRTLPKRFYKEAGVVETDGGFQLVLDGRPAKTPAKSALALPTRAAGELVAAEWAAQGEVINPATMPITRIANSTIDGVAREIEAVRVEITKYASSDLLCYRAADPPVLCAEQAASWDPILDWAHETLGARLILSEGVMYVAQPEPALAAIARAVEAIPAPFALACVHVMTTLSGSALLGLAVFHGRLTAEDAWAAAHVDEDFQARFWGEDAEAIARRARRFDDMTAAARLLAAVQGIANI